MSDNPSDHIRSFVTAANVVPWERVESFIGQLSHDLRNSLNACELQLTFLAEISTDPDASSEVKSLRSTLNSITKQLQTIRSAVGSSKAHKLAYPANDLLEDLRERFQRLHPAVTRRIDWKTEVEDSRVVDIDPEITLGAVLELLNNATVFADLETPIACEIGEMDGQVHCSVTEQLETEPAVAVSDWGYLPLLSTRRGAYGLGLFKARRSLQAQGSTLTFQYSAANKTLAATIALPLATVSQV